MIDKIIKDFHNLEEVEAVVLGGSRATDTYDENSDYDFYIYLSKELHESKRRRILEPHVKYMEFSNQFWELEDDGILNNDIEIEFIYRTLEDFESMLENVFIKGNVSNGYTTCFVDNLLRSKVMFDKNSRFNQLRKKYSEILQDWDFSKIVDHNYPILMDHMPSLYYQVEKAFKRNDIYAINHRSTAYFEMYFDILFAINKVTHPGEKRLLEIASNLSLKPVDMKRDIEDYFTKLFDQDVDSLAILERMSRNLHSLLLERGYNYPINSFKENA